MGANLLALARYTLKGPYQAAAVVGLFAILAAFIPPMLGNSFSGLFFGSLCLLLSSALVSLIILTQGSVSGLKTIVVAMLGITLVGWALINVPGLGLWVGLMQWLPIILLSQALRSTRSLEMTLMVGVALGTIAIAAQFVLLGTMDLDLLAETFQGMGPSDEQQLIPAEQAKQIVQVFVLGMVAMIFLFVVLIVMLARWMQSSLAESTRFGEEFHGLALGKTAAMIALVVAGLSFGVQHNWMVSLLYLVVVAFMFQGIAVVHAKVKGKKQATLILVVFYIVLLIAPQAVALTALTGVIDNWLVFRKRAVKPSDENEV
jgi:hypothetical protein